MVINVEKKLRDNILDDATYTKRQIRRAIFGLVIGLWGPFIAVLIVLFMCVKEFIG